MKLFANIISYLLCFARSHTIEAIPNHHHDSQNSYWYSSSNGYISDVLT